MVCKRYKQENQVHFPSQRIGGEVRKLKEEVAEAETVKRCVEQTVQQIEQRTDKYKGRDMAL